MSNFDVFINGIQPAQKAKTQQIIEEFGQRLKINSQRAEKILNTPNTRISQSVPLEKAEKLQQALNKIGAICVYRPSTISTGLSLEPIDVKEEGALTACPNCEHDFPGNSKAIPEKCDYCGVYIEKFLRVSKDQHEKDLIKQNLEQKNSFRTAREQQIKNEQAEEIRKKILKQAVLNENKNLDTKEESNNKTTVLIGGSILIAAVASGISYFYFEQQDNLPTEIAYSSPEITTAQSTFQDTNELSTEIPQASDSQNNIDGLATEIPATSVNINESQNALKNTHDQAQQVLSAFGLNTDAFAEASSKANSSSLKRTALNSSPIIQDSSNEVLNIAPHLFLLDSGVDIQERDHYLIIKAEQLITNNTLVNANQIISYLTATEKFITLSGLLLRNNNQANLTAKINSDIEAKIKKSPIGMQAQLFSLAALHQTKKDSSDFLFSRAESSWETLSNPNEQLSSALKIAVSYFKSGNTKSANRYFSQITTG